jgi:AbrB family looped-hinge helix DNA binding protein
MNRGVVSEKGQITIPKPLRESLGIRAGTELQFEEKDGALMVVPIVPMDPIDALVGLGDRQPVDHVLAATRGPAYDPDVDGG